MKQFALSLLALLLPASHLFCQNYLLSLTSGDSYPKVELHALEDDTLVVISQDGKTLRMPVNLIKEINPWKPRLAVSHLMRLTVGSLVGGVAGYVAGLVVSEFALRWISNEDNPKGWMSNPDSEEGDKSIAGVFTGIAIIIGSLHGFDWAMEKVRRSSGYNISQMTSQEKLDTISGLF